MNIHPEVFIPYDVQLRIKELFPTCTEVYKYGPYVCDNIVTLFANETFLIGKRIKISTYELSKSNR